MFTEKKKEEKKRKKILRLRFYHYFKDALISQYNNYQLMIASDGAVPSTVGISGIIVDV